ncbi:MAG: deoxyguanosinetriphosphate triphosphohydrolase [Vampirovibrionales bacterium]|nr:deoxyguanosinetriphosphate triphosphohydrolase [Vampirovibrionales bacterium]
MRVSIEAREADALHPFAALSRDSGGRGRPEAPCPIRTCFQRDRDRILHSKAFRRLKHKTQVFISPMGDHTRTRLTHTLEVAQIARTLARALQLNEDLTEAVALGHDLGHPPYGHSGEAVLDELFGEKLAGDGFRHERQSLRIVSHLEPLNLSREVFDGMAAQSQDAAPATLEAALVKIADRIAYLHHDVEDAVRADMMREEDLPVDVRRALGPTRRERLDALVLDLVCETRRRFSLNRREIALSDERYEAMMALRAWMFTHIYLGAAQREQKTRVQRLLSGLVDHYLAHSEQISDHIPRYEADGALTPAHWRVRDYVAGMTDRYALELYLAHRLPTSASAAPVDERLRS